jgi:hypothetical protein
MHSPLPFPKRFTSLHKLLQQSVWATTVASTRQQSWLKSLALLTSSRRVKMDHQTRIPLSKHPPLLCVLFVLGWVCPPQECLRNFEALHSSLCILDTIQPFFYKSL